jgi:hypothetical protein
LEGNHDYSGFAEGFANGIKFHVGYDKDSGLTHSVVTTAANVHDPIPQRSSASGGGRYVLLVFPRIAKPREMKVGFPRF